jgi:hypothetical protein
MVVGFVEWREKNTSDATWIKSPLILVPVLLVLESLNAPYILKKYEDDIVVNPTLAYLFERDYGNSYSKPTTDTNNIEMDLNITIQANDPMPKFSKDYKSIDDITEDDIYNWVESLEEDAY